MGWFVLLSAVRHRCISIVSGFKHTSNQSRDTIHSWSLAMIVAIVALRCLDTILSSHYYLHGVTSRGTDLRHAVPMLRPCRLDVRDCPVWPRCKAPLYAIQCPAPGKLRVNPVIVQFRLLRESDMRLWVREDMASVALFVWIGCVVLVKSWGLAIC